MKWVYWLLGLIVAVPALAMAVMYGASELGGEVVTLERAESDGSTSRVRIWIVDQDGRSWIEHGAADSHWITRLAESPELTLSREGRTLHYLGTADPDSRDLYHRLRREKYGWADQIVELLTEPADACTGIPVRLAPID